MSSDQTPKRLQKGSSPDQLPHFRHRGQVGSGSGISTDCHLYCAGQRRVGSVLIIQPVHRKICTENALNNRYGDLCESGIISSPDRSRSESANFADSDSDSEALAHNPGTKQYFMHLGMPCTALRRPYHVTFHISEEFSKCETRRQRFSHRSVSFRRQL